MASAIPVPGQPGRLFIPGNNYGTTMKLSDLSMGQLDEQEQEQLNGLGDLGQVKPGSTRTTWRLGDNDATKVLADGRRAADVKGLSETIQMLKKNLNNAGYKMSVDGNYDARLALALRLVYREYPKARPGIYDRDEKAQMGEAFDANIGTIAKEILDKGKARQAAMTSTAIVPTQAGAPAVAPAAATDAPSAAAPGYGSPGGFAALLKNPVYWVGLAAVVGIGLYLFTRSRRSVQAVGEVETLALEGMKKPRRKRRKSKKAKA